MGVFSWKFRDVMNFSETINKEYEMICYEFDKVANMYSIKSELYSDQVWEYLSGENDISEENIITTTDIEMDEKNHKHKTFTFIVKFFLDNGKFVYLTFSDEQRGYEDKDYHGYVTEDDKSNKIFNMIIYYDPIDIATQDLEKSLVKDLLECSYLPSTKNQFFTIATNQFGFTLKTSYVKEMDIDIKTNYGKPFIQKHEKILKKLKDLNHGLFLFHGEPGTGKTTYIRKLISILSEDKTIIYVPSYMMASVADPEFISFIGGFKNTILLLEDAENILTTSISDRSQAVSNILNMTDGLLNDYMDPALKRAGRLQVNHKFGLLSKADANKLSKKLGLNKKYDKSASLSEIYEGSNQLIDDDLVEENKIGFN